MLDNFFVHSKASHYGFLGTGTQCAFSFRGTMEPPGMENPDTPTVGHCLFSYLLSVDRFDDRSSTPDNKQEVNDIEDDEHKCDQGHHKSDLKIHTKQVGNKAPQENHKWQCH